MKVTVRKFRLKRKKRGSILERAGGTLLDSYIYRYRYRYRQASEDDSCVGLTLDTEEGDTLVIDTIISLSFVFVQSDSFCVSHILWNSSFLSSMAKHLVQ